MSDLVMKLDEQNFEKEVIKSEVPVLVDFWAEWCGPCKMLAPSVEKIAQTMNGQVKVGKLNIDEATSIAGKFKIMSIPTLILFKAGTNKASLVGNRPYEAIEKFVKENM